MVENKKNENWPSDANKFHPAHCYPKTSTPKKDKVSILWRTNTLPF